MSERNLLWGIRNAPPLVVTGNFGFLAFDDNWKTNRNLLILENFDLKAGDILRFSAKVSTSSGKKLRLRIEFYESESNRTSRMSEVFACNETKTMTMGCTIPEGYELFRIGLDSNLSGDTHTTNTTETISECILTKGEEIIPWHPAPEDVLFTALAPGDVEQGVISWGPPSAGKTYQEMKLNSGDYFLSRARTTDLIPLLGRSVFCIDVPEGLRIIPYYFDSDGLSMGTDDANWRTGMQTYTVPSGAAYAAIYFSNADGSAITPEDVTNVTGGGVLTDGY